MNQEDPMDSTFAPEAVYRSHGKLVHDLALAIVGSVPDAEDVAHDVFLRLCERPAFDPQRGSVGALLIAMTRSRAIDRLRRRSRDLRVRETCRADAQHLPALPTPYERLAAGRSAFRLRAALAALPKSERRVL